MKKKVSYENNNIQFKPVEFRQTEFVVQDKNNDIVFWSNKPEVMEFINEKKHDVQKNMKYGKDIYDIPEYLVSKRVYSNGNIEQEEKFLISILLI